MTEARTFPDPHHDHRRCAADALSHAEQICRESGARLTPTRRRVLETLLASHRPLGAYDIIDRFAQDGARPAPITIYRALDFLMENALVHRIESRNAYLACAHNHDASALVGFLICERCGSVGEVDAAPLAKSLDSAAHHEGFQPKLSVLEITGICAHCNIA